MTNLLFEITTYDIPYDLQLQAEKDVKNLFEEALKKLKISFSCVLSFSTNRRIVLYIPEIDKETRSITTIKKGPPSNSNSNIIEKFLNTNKITLSDCYKEVTPKGEFFFFKKVIKGNLLKNQLAKIITDEVLSKVNFKRSMFWNETKVKWARPITNLVLFLGEENIKFSFAGVDSSNVIQGHIYLNNFLELKTAKEYFKTIKDIDIVLVSFKEQLQQLQNYIKKYSELRFLTTSREEVIIPQINSFANNNSVKPNISSSLLVELLYLTERPVVLFGSIPNKYLSLPKELLVNTLVKNQRYINFFNKKDEVSSHFALVGNIQAIDGGTEIIKGNQRVINARLDDGLFFYNLDMKEDWLHKVNKLKQVSFFDGLGSLFDKQERLKELATQFFPKDNLENICRFCKVDLISKVVGEFPDLQGIMGYYYAKLSGFSEAEAVAIKEQYLPLSSQGNIPNSVLGAKLSYLDKLDTLKSFFGVNKAPTSSSDPYALRRAALGIIKISIGYKFCINLQLFVDTKLLDFFKERLIIYLSSLGIKKEITSAVIDSSYFDIAIIYQKASILNQHLNNNKDLIELYKRVYNILYNNEIEKEEICEKLLITNEEKALYKYIINLKQNFKNIYFENKEIYQQENFINDYNNYVKEVIKLKAELDVFLNNNLIINNNEPELTRNRLSLLKLVLCAVQKIGNLEKVNLV